MTPFPNDAIQSVACEKKLMNFIYLIHDNAMLIRICVMVQCVATNKINNF